MVNIAELIEQVKHFHEVKNFEKAIEAATLLIHLGDEAEHMTALGSVYAFALQVRCYAYVGLKNYAEALEDADIIVQILPHETIGYSYRSSALLQLDEIERAKEDLTHLLSFNLPPDQRVRVHHSMGLVEYIAGNYDISIHHYVKAIQLDPAKHLLSYVNMGIIYFCQGDMAAAWNAYKTAQQLDPSHDSVQMGLAVLHADEGQWDEALAIWHSLAAQHDVFTDVEKVVERYYHWTPPMADLVRQIAARAGSAAA